MPPSPSRTLFRAPLAHFIIHRGRPFSFCFSKLLLGKSAKSWGGKQAPGAHSSVKWLCLCSLSRIPHPQGQRAAHSLVGPDILLQSTTVLGDSVGRKTALVYPCQSKAKNYCICIQGYLTPRNRTSCLVTPPCSSQCKGPQSCARQCRQQIKITPRLQQTEHASSHQQARSFCKIHGRVLEKRQPCTALSHNPATPLQILPTWQI